MKENNFRQYLKQLISNKLLTTFLITFIFCLMICVKDSSALSIGVSPVSIEFGNMLRSGYAERSVTISTSDARNLTGHFVKLGEIADWIRIGENIDSIVLSNSNPYSLKIIAEPPSDAANGVYKGEVRFVTDSVIAPEGTTGSAVKASVTITITIQIIDKQIVECSYGTSTINDAEIDTPLQIIWLTRNGGNVRFQPKIQVDIWDRDKINLLLSKEFIGSDVLPTTEKTFTQRISTEKLAIGQYWVVFNIKECDYSYTSTFDILEKGSISDKGSLISVSAPPWVYAGDIVPIKARFTNSGTRTVTAKFKGDVKQDDKIIQLLESDEISALPQETLDLTVFFQPKTEGTYVVNGKIFYNKKITFEKSTIINAQKKKFSINYSSVILLLVYTFILIAIIFLIRKIKKSKKS